MEYILILKGVFIGMMISSPFGPVGLIFIQRSLENEKYEGVASGFGIATGDMLYSIITTFGITLLDDILAQYVNWFKLIAFIILVIMGVRTLRVKIDFAIKEAHQRSLFQAFGISFLLALHNPSSIVIFAFLFGIFRIGEIITLSNGFLLIGGIYAGSSFLWFMLNQMIHYVKETGKINYLIIFYRWSGVLLFILSIAVLLSMVK